MDAGKDEKGKPELLELDDPLQDVVESGIIPVQTVKPPPGAGLVRDRQMTLVDDDITEQARLASVLIDSTPPRALDPSQAIRARLSPLHRVPVLVKSFAELTDDLKEPKAAFVLGFIDGVLPLETIIEVTCLPEQDTLRILGRLLELGAIRL